MREMRPRSFAKDSMSLLFSINWVVRVSKILVIAEIDQTRRKHLTRQMVFSLKAIGVGVSHERGYCLLSVFWSSRPVNDSVKVQKYVRMRNTKIRI